jgi:hypothetical protein
MAPAGKGHQLAPNIEAVEETRRSGYTNVENYENRHSEATELPRMARNETPHPFDTAEGLVRLIAAFYQDRGRGLVSISRHNVQEINA